MFWGGADIPADNPMFTEGSASVCRNVGDDASAGGSNGCAIKVVVAKHGGVRR
jgi:hypothetical protein